MLVCRSHLLALAITECLVHQLCMNIKGDTGVVPP